MSRWKAAAFHFCISIVVAAVASALLVGVWYPSPYFHAGGAGKLLALVIGVDVSIGPLLTLLVFKSGKRGLKFDLVVIGILQAIALGYGFHVLVGSRPVFMVAAVDRFVIVSADDISEPDLAEAPRPEWRHLSWTGPVLVGATLPTNPNQRNQLLFSSLQGGKDIQDLPEYFVPYTQAAPELLKHARPIRALMALHPTARGMVEGFLKRHGYDDARAKWLPIQARGGDLTMLVDGNSGEPIGALQLFPWATDLPASTRQLGKTKTPIVNPKPSHPNDPPASRQH